MRVSWIVLGVSLLSWLGCAQDEPNVLHRSSLGSGSANGGRAVAFAGDVDKDGHDDFVVGYPLEDASGGTDQGVVRVISGRTGLVIWTVSGATTNENLGECVTGGKDVNGDGWPDFAAGGQHDSTTARLRVYSGRTGLQIAVWGPAPLGIGTSVAFIDDIDGDGRAEIVAGAPFHDTATLTSCGRVLVFKIGLLGPIVTFTGNVNLQWLGFSVASAGDLDGDGRPEILAGAPRYNPGFPNSFMGRVVAYSPYLGSETPPLWDFVPPIATSGNTAECGWSVCSLGDVNGDGVPDIAAGAHGYENASTTDDGRVYVVSGIDPPAAGPSILYTLTGSSGSGQKFGEQVTSIADINGDGIRDLLVSAPLRDATNNAVGFVQIYSGLTSLPIRFLFGDQTLAEFGDALASGGDVNGDGIEDFIIGSPGYDLPNGSSVTSRGRVDVVSGARPIREHVDNTGPLTSAGHRVGVLGDVNGDGLDEYLIGRPDPAGNGANHGSVQVRDGMSGGVLATLSLPGLAADEFGFSVASAGDFDGDGVLDVAIGAPGFAPGGRAYVYSGATFSPLATIVPPVASVRFGYRVAQMGDADGDGFDDVLVSDPAYSPNPALSPDQGRAGIYRGPAGALLVHAISGSPNDRLGEAIAGVGDIDGDGHADWAYSQPFNTFTATDVDTGWVVVLSGNPALSYMLLGTVQGISGEEFGTSIAPCGDVDGDGTPDFIVGGPGYTTTIGAALVQRGRARVISGATFATISSRSGETTGDRFGTTVAAGDFDGDGRVDFAAGAPFGDGSDDVDVGYTLLWSGADGRQLARIQGANTSLGVSGASLGTSIAGPLRATNDHRDELLVATTKDSTTSPGFKTLVTGYGRLDGVAHYGGGTPGCRGRIVLSASSRPTVGNAAFAFLATNLEPGITGTLLLTVDGYQAPLGLDPTGFGIIVHVDWTVAPLLLQAPMLADGHGIARVTAPIPDVPSLEGFVVSAQAIFYSATPCVGPAIGFSTTNGLDLTIR